MTSGLGQTIGDTTRGIGNYDVSNTVGGATGGVGEFEKIFFSLV